MTLGHGLGHGLRLGVLVVLGILAAAADADGVRTATADGIELEVAWSPDEPSLLDAVTLSVVVRHEPGHALGVADAIDRAADPSMADEVLGPMLGDFLVRVIRTSPPIRADDGRIVRQWFIELEPFVPGTARLPALRFRLEGRGAVEVEPIVFEIASVIASDGLDLDVGSLSEPLEPPEPSRFPYGAVALVIILSMLALVVGVLGYAVLASLRKPPPLFERAFALIREQRELIASNPNASERELRQAWRVVAEQFAKCIGVRLEPRAPRLAFEELGRLADLWFGLTEQDRSDLRELLTELDAVRYADARIERESTIAMLHQAEHLLGRVQSASELVVDDDVEDQLKDEELGDSDSKHAASREGDG